MRRQIKDSILISMLIFVPVASNLPAFVDKPAVALRGTASWYSEMDPGIHVHTANGEIFDDSKRTCASWDFPFGTYLKVTNLKNGKSIICRINDRGPSKRLGRRIDLTQATFRKIADLRLGVIQVSVAPVHLEKGRGE